MRDDNKAQNILYSWFNDSLHRKFITNIIKELWHSATVREIKEAIKQI